MRFNIIALTITACVILTSCTLLSPVKVEPDNNYELTALPHIKREAHSRKINLLVAVPETNTAYNTVNIAYTNRPYLLAYYSKNRWAETPAEMLHPLMVEAIQKSNYFHAVVTPPFTGQYQYLLMTKINKLQFDFLRSPAVVHLNLRVQLIRMSNNQIIATENINVDRRMEKPTPYAGVFAANDATEEALVQIVRFTKRYSH